ncbi:hypothetical protein CDAR_56261 [Caerostris darwini]|uniref:Uncharacterized protein n=1 Tax=Caerostris darwini TaxID=1538125 RepID=A0AAV4RQV9_9ARAC|nr:hypothetical protein CDAR_56261 [Caerostris darwini]
MDNNGCHIIPNEATSIITLQVESRLICEENNSASSCGPVDLVNPDQKLSTMRVLEDSSLSDWLECSVEKFVLLHGCIGLMENYWWLSK